MGNELWFTENKSPGTRDHHVSLWNAKRHHYQQSKDGDSTKEADLFTAAAVTFYREKWGESETRQRKQKGTGMSGM